MNMRPATPLEAQRIARTAVSIDKARLASVLRSIAEADGYGAARLAADDALRSLAAMLREENILPGAWIG